MAVIYLCPADKRLSCPWEGYASEIKQHFENEHNELLFQSNSVQIEIDKLPENKLLYLEEEVFLMQNDTDGDKIILKLRYLGSNETASQKQYSVAISLNEIIYRHDPLHFSCVVPSTEGWEINLKSLEKFHGKIESFQCTLFLEGSLETQRKLSAHSLRINNVFVENNACDETETSILQDLSFLDTKLENLKRQQSEENDKIEKQRESGDFMDKVSQLNFSMLEEPFSYESPEMELLPNIPEELNLSCSSCNLDMLPPIYLCVNDHNICTPCSTKPCKICNGAVTTNRNTALEDVSRTHKHQCRYSSEGCSERLLYNEVRAHEARCAFSKYKCMSDCPYEGRFDHFKNHLKIVHSSVKIGEMTKNDFPKNSEMYVVNKSVGIFYCTSELSNDFVIWRAHFCGPSERQFFCEINFKGSKYKEPIVLRKKGNNVWEVRKPVSELKKYKAKEKYAVLTITSYDS